MYLEFYRLREPPFAITCDARFFYESAAHAEALANMVYTVRERKGMVLVTGEVGAGKTFLGEMLGSRLGGGYITMVLRNPPQTGNQFIRAIAGQLEMDVPARTSRTRLLEDMEDRLTRLHNRGVHLAMVIDEAQNLTASSLEQLRLLWNWERDGQRLAQFVLIGQPELRDVLARPKWEALRQRIALSYHLGPLTPQDTAAYIAHRLRVASDGQCVAEFKPKAVDIIHAATDGIPRPINTMCDNALLVGYAKGTRVIDKALVEEVLRDMTC